MQDQRRNRTLGDVAREVDHRGAQPRVESVGQLCDLPDCFRSGPHRSGELGCSEGPVLVPAQAPALEQEGPVPAPSWLAPWTAGSWVRRTTEEANAGHRAWFADLSAPLKELFLRHPPGEVIELRWDCLPRSVEGFAFALWSTRHGIVIGYLDPTPEMQELGVPPEGALVLLESPDPAAACQGVVFEREVARAIGHLQGYDPAAARLNLLGEAATETPVSVAAVPAPAEGALSRAFWVSWWAGDEAFTLSCPWWFSGERGDGKALVCAAVMADGEDGARTLVAKAHDNPAVELEWRFVEERPAGWTPFGDRFQQAAWMVWPWPPPP